MAEDLEGRKMKKILSVILALALAASSATVSVCAAGDLPAYTETVSTSTDYAYYGGEQWDAAPMTVKAEIHAREKYTLALCTDYWANVSVFGYNASPTELVPSFTSGDGLLSFSVCVDAGPIWNGATCELLTITPTDAAFEITEPVVAEGSISIYWRGWTNMPFSVTINPYTAKTTVGEVPTDPNLPPYMETSSSSTDYARFGGEEWNVEPMTVEAEIRAREKYTLALATSYWADPSKSGYGEEPTFLPVEFTSGDGLLSFSVRIGAGQIWGGAECELLTITPTDAAYTLTESTTATGTIDIFWRGDTKMPFSVTIHPAEMSVDEISGLIYTVGGDDSEDIHIEAASDPAPIFVKNKASLDEMAEGYDLRDDVYAFFDIWAKGESATSISRKIDLSAGHTPMPLMKESVIAGLPCVYDGFDCDGLASCTWENANVRLTENGDLVDITFSGENGMALLDVCLTEAGEAEQVPFTVCGEFFFDNGEHISEGIPFAFTIVEKGNGAPGGIDIQKVIMIAEGFVILAEAGAIICLVSKKGKAKTKKG